MKFEEMVKVIDVRQTVAKNESDQIKSIKVLVFAEDNEGNAIEGCGVATTHPDDLDLATQKTGFDIAIQRAYIDILKNLASKTEDEKSLIDDGVKSFQEEINALISQKEKFYQRIRAIRRGDQTNKVRQFVVAEDGKKALEL